jgi:acetyl esterase/lipase
MKLFQFITLTLLLVMLCGCKGKSGTGSEMTKSDSVTPVDMNLLQARTGFTTKLLRKDADGVAAEEPPANIFQLVNYRAELGEMSAYVSPRPPDGKKHPAIIWIVGGFSNSIGPNEWTPAPVEDDQSASALRQAGIIMMFPSLRGGNDNPGFMENWYGEVNDVLAAEDYLSKLDYVDPKRIYLGGHSTGGTLAMLVSESSDKFRAVFAFGPIDDVRHYDPKELEFDPSDAKESELRSPIKWLAGIHTPTFAFEGTERPSNITPLKAMTGVCRNPVVHFYPVKGATHFTVLAPVTRLVAGKILLDSGPEVNITFTEDELAAPFSK